MRVYKWACINTQITITTITRTLELVEGRAAELNILRRWRFEQHQWGLTRNEPGGGGGGETESVGIGNQFLGEVGCGDQGGVVVGDQCRGDVYGVLKLIDGCLQVHGYRVGRVRRWRRKSNDPIDHN